MYWLLTLCFFCSLFDKQFIQNIRVFVRKLFDHMVARIFSGYSKNILISFMNHLKWRCAVWSCLMVNYCFDPVPNGQSKCQLFSPNKNKQKKNSLFNVLLKLAKEWYWVAEWARTWNWLELVVKLLPCWKWLRRAYLKTWLCSYYKRFYFKILNK